MRPPLKQRNTALGHYICSRTVQVMSTLTTIYQNYLCRGNYSYIFFQAGCFMAIGYKIIRGKCV